MIKFFRKIRQKLLSENRFGKYLIYAIGEIILVVLGILIALQINTWNENQKLKQEEIKALREIQEGFKADTLDLSYNITSLQKAANSGQLILKVLNSSTHYHDSLDVHFANSLQITRLISNDGPYDVLKTKGLDLISNDRLRKRIIDIYDGRYESLRTWEKGFFIYDRHVLEECIDLFDVVQFFDYDPNGIIVDAKMVPNDFEALKSNERYKTMIKTYAAQSRLFLWSSKDVKEQLTELLEVIDNELKILSK